MIGHTENTIFALQTAMVAHASQTRPGGELPYVAHPIGVADITSEMVEGDEDSESKIIAAYLHDIFEKVSPDVYGRDAMLADFGEEVVHLVDLMTHEQLQDGVDWRKPKEAQVEALLRDDFVDIQELALADKLEHARYMVRRYSELLKLHPELGDGFWRRFKGGRENYLWWFGILRDEVFVASRMPSHTHYHVEQFGSMIVQLEALGGVSLDRTRI